MLVYRVEDNRVMQHFSPKKYLVPNGSQNAIAIGFLFDESWQPYTTKFVQFTKFGISYNVMLNDKNSCFLPAQLTDGEWLVSVFGLVPNEAGKRMTSISSKLTVIPCSYNPSGVAPEPPEDDYYTIMFDQMKEMATGVAENSEVAEQAAIVAVEARKTCEELADAAQGQIEQITEDVTAAVQDKFYLKEETYSKVEISTEGEIALTPEDINAILV